MKTAYLWEFSEFKRYVPGNIWSFLSRVSLFENAGIDKKTTGMALLDEIQLIIISSGLISLLLTVGIKLRRIYAALKRNANYYFRFGSGNFNLFFCSRIYAKTERR
jgi:hypothetical protein